MTVGLISAAVKRMSRNKKDNRVTDFDWKLTDNYEVGLAMKTCEFLIRDILRFVTSFLTKSNEIMQNFTFMLLKVSELQALKVYTV